MSTSFAYINDMYGLTLKRGSRIEYTGDKDAGPKLGSVTGATGAHINVRFDGDAKPTGPFHPTWEIRQIDRAKP